MNNPPLGYQVDPFYAFFPAAPNTFIGTGNRLRLSFSGCAAALECGAEDILLFMKFVDGVGFVDPPRVTDLDLLPIMQRIIPYNSSTHTYKFIIDVEARQSF